MIEAGKTYLVMGLLNTDSIAFYIGETIQRMGGKVIYTMLNERMKRIFLDRSRDLTAEQRDALEIRYCDVTVDDQVKALFAGLPELGGVVHSIAYGNPKTLLGREFHTDAYDDLKIAFHISAVSLATVVRYAQANLPQGGGVCALTFDSHHAYPYYNWMGVNKAALEAVVRALARRHGKDLIRVNAVSAGPVDTKAAGAIEGFSELAHTWQMRSPLPWDGDADKQAVADAAVYLIGCYSKKITGQVLHVDGGVSITGADVLPHERNL
jgi:enoyl-[acyl-carrier protein] reductase I